MDAKEILRLVVQYRFWITLGVASLLFLVGYFVGTGPLNKQIEAKTNEIKTAQTNAQKYTSGDLPNGQYPEFTKKEIDQVSTDVNSAWTRLYNRQAPLLNWPKAVEREFKKWGRAYPKEESDNLIQAVAIDYTNAYPDFVDKVYATVKPWDGIEGTGIVVVPPKEQLLSVATFDENEPPTLTRIWELQEGLWVRRSVLDVIAKVNEKAGAKDWESAPIKQLEALYVGNPGAIDHLTIAKEGIKLQDPQPLEPGAALVEAPAAAPASGSARSGGMDEGRGSSGGAASGPTERMQFLRPDGVDQYRIYPAMIRVLIDQNYLQDFLAEFENSPMTMQVKEVNWKRPSTRVTPPVKGEAQFANMGGYGGMGGGSFGGRGMSEMMMMGSGSGGRGAYGAGYGAGGADQASMMGQMMAGSGGGGRGMYGAMGGGASAAAPPRKKTDRLEEVKKNFATKKAEEETKEEVKKNQIFDPYYNVISVEVYTQARFYDPPPAPPTVEPAIVSPGDIAADVQPADASAEPAADAAASTTPAADSEATDAPAAEAKDEEQKDAENSDAPAAKPGDAAPTTEEPAPSPAPDKPPAPDTPPSPDTPKADPAPADAPEPSPPRA
jgi:hypothetical protein